MKWGPTGTGSKSLPGHCGPSSSCRPCPGTSFPWPQLLFAPGHERGSRPGWGLQLVSVSISATSPGRPCQRLASLFDLAEIRGTPSDQMRAAEILSLTEGNRAERVWPCPGTLLRRSQVSCSQPDTLPRPSRALKKAWRKQRRRPLRSEVPPLRRFQRRQLDSLASSGSAGLWGVT